MKMLVTGATGFVGQHVARRLAASGDVVLFAHDAEKARDMFGDQFEIRAGDLRDVISLEAGLQGIDVVYHIAARRDHWGLPYEDYYSSNVIGTQNLLSAARKLGTSKVVYCSTVGVYGYDFEYLPVDEAHPFGKNMSYYHETKALAEVVLKDYADVPVITVRPGWIYGPQDEWGGVTQMLIKLAKGQFAFIGRGNNQLHPVYIDDIISGIVAAGGSNRFGESYLLLGPESTTFREYVFAMCTALGVDRPRWTIPYPVGLASCYILEPVWLLKNRLLGKKPLGDKPPMTRDTLRGVSANRFYDTSKASREIGHTPGVKIADGLERTVDWLAGTGRLPVALVQQLKDRRTIPA